MYVYVYIYMHMLISTYKSLSIYLVIHIYLCICIPQKISSKFRIPPWLQGAMVIRNSRPSAKPNHQTQIDSLDARISQ